MSRVAIDLGFIQIYWYSICIIIGMSIGMWFVFKEAKRKHINEDVMTSIIFNTIIWAIIGARLYYVVFNLPYYSKHVLEIFEIWNGGLAIHGGILFGTLYVIYFTKKHKLKTLRVMDICAVGLIIGQIFGRWGNFFNGEAYGPVVSKSFLESLMLPRFIIDGMYINGVYHHPTFLYESILDFLIFILLVVILSKKKTSPGVTACAYLFLYSLVRIFIEAIRVDSALDFGSLHVAQVVSVVLMILALVFYFLLNKKSAE